MTSSDDYIAVATQKSAAGEVQEALVSHGPSDVAIIASRIGSAWEPRFALINEEMRDLPSCFSLADEAIEALNQLVESIEGTRP